MLSTQPQACPPVRFSRLAKTALASATALAGFSPLSQAAFLEDSSGTLETRNMYFNRDHADLLAKINVKGDFNDEIDAGMKAGIEKFKATQTW